VPFGVWDTSAISLLNPGVALLFSIAFAFGAFAFADVVLFW
jgi:hypothetical protein